MQFGGRRKLIFALYTVWLHSRVRVRRLRGRGWETLREDQCSCQVHLIEGWEEGCQLEAWRRRTSQSDRVIKGLEVVLRQGFFRLAGSGNLFF